MARIYYPLGVVTFSAEGVCARQSLADHTGKTRVYTVAIGLRNVRCDMWPVVRHLGRNGRARLDRYAGLGTLHATWAARDHVASAGHGTRRTACLAIHLCVDVKNDINLQTLDMRPEGPARVTGRTH